MSRIEAGVKAVIIEGCYFYPGNKQFIGMECTVGRQASASEVSNPSNIPGPFWLTDLCHDLAFPESCLIPIPGDSTWLTKLMEKPVEAFGSQEYKDPLDVPKPVIVEKVE